MAGPKNGEGTQAQLVSPNALRSGAGFGALPAGNGCEPLCDANGRPWVNALPSGPAGLASRWQYPMDAAPAPGFSVLGNPGVLEQASGLVTGALGPGVITYVQIFDGLLGIPVMQIPIVGAGTWQWSPGQGFAFAVGIDIGFSATLTVFTPIVGGGLVSATGWQP